MIFPVEKWSHCLLATDVNQSASQPMQQVVQQWADTSLHRMYLALIK